MATAWRRRLRSLMNGRGWRRPSWVVVDLLERVRQARLKAPLKTIEHIRPRSVGGGLGVPMRNMGSSPEILEPRRAQFGVAHRVLSS